MAQLGLKVTTTTILRKEGITKAYGCTYTVSVGE